MGSAAPERDVQWLTDLYLAGRLPLDSLIGDRIRLEDVPRGFEQLHHGVVGRQLIEIGTSW